VQGAAVDCRLETLFGETLGASVSAFADAGGAVIRFTLGQGLGHLEHDLPLHDRPPAAPRMTAETLLTELPALEPGARHFDLDFVAQAYGVAIHGRHTAFGDAIAAAELFIRFLPMLEAHGITTLGQAMAFQMTGRRSSFFPSRSPTGPAAASRAARSKCAVSSVSPANG
jgi:hypothetical protein